MKKRILSLVISALVILSTIGTISINANDDIKVLVNGNKLAFDVSPQLINNRTMVPLRAIFEALGASVDWDGNTQTVTSTKDGVTIRMAINNPIMSVNGTEVALDSPACLVDSRTLVPVRAISEAFGTKVDWDGNSKTVMITTNSYKYSGYGNKVITNINLPAGHYYALFTHSGSRNFITKLFYGNSRTAYITNEIGECSGQSALESMRNTVIENGYLEVQADGEWGIEIVPVSGTTTTNIKGTGETVTGLFTATEATNVLTLTHNGQRNFITKIFRYGSNGTEYVTNEIGVYSGQKVVQLNVGEKYYISIQADGDWTIDFGKGDAVTTYSVPEISMDELTKDCVHEIVTAPGVEATCTASGKTDEEKCTKCGRVIKKQEVTKALGHDYDEGICSRCGESNPDYIPKFEMGETWNVPENFSFTVNSVDIHNECNPKYGESGAAVILIEYTYANKGYEGDLYMSGMEFKVYDGEGENAKLYPCTHQQYPAALINGKKCTASIAYVLANKSDEISFAVEEFATINGKLERVKAEFTLPLKGKSTSKKEDLNANPEVSKEDIYEIADSLKQGKNFIESAYTTADSLVKENRLPTTEEEIKAHIKGIVEHAADALPYFKEAMKIAENNTFSNDRIQGMLDDLYDECKALSEISATYDTEGMSNVEIKLISVQALCNVAYDYFNDLK